MGFAEWPYFIILHNHLTDGLEIKPNPQTITIMYMAKSVEEYFEHHLEQREILETLREIILETELEETLKWGHPLMCWRGNMW